MVVVGPYISDLLTIVARLPSIVFSDDFFYLFGAVISFGILIRLVKVSVGL